VKLAEMLGGFAGQLTEDPITGIKLEYEGNVAALNTKPMTAAALNGVLKPQMQEVNMVSAPQVAKDRGINVEIITRDQQGAYEGYIRLTVITEKQERGVAGTVFGAGKPRIIQSRASTWRRK
jgi:D-3-phosphoglycerate dehydrogenase